jgi:very-short-patch-repair endonuclease
MVQLASGVPGLGEPTRQLEVLDDGLFVARLDLSWPTIGLFIELDGQQHLGQPLYDARRETAVVAVTGWLPGRFTWYEVTRIPRSTTRPLAALAAARTA